MKKPKEKVTDPFEKIAKSIVNTLNRLGRDDRMKLILDLQHRLECERRWADMTDEELFHMHDKSLSPAARARLAKARSKKEEDELITMYARAAYFRDCAWRDYLNGVIDEKPFDSKEEAKKATA